MFILLALAACSWHQPVPTDIDAPVVDVAIVPGCPTEDDGSLSTCLWRRTTWAARLYELGVADRFITSGNAAYNRYVEAEAIAAGLVALGVPEEAITLEPQALHTDENIGYAWKIAKENGWSRIGIASDASQAGGGCAMLKSWGHEDCTVLALDPPWTYDRMAEGLPEVRIEPVPADAWLPLKEREKAIAEARGVKKRPPSIVYYGVKMMGFGKRVAPEPPEDHEVAMLMELAANQ